MEAISAIITCILLVLASLQRRRSESMRFLSNLRWEDWKESFRVLCFTAWTSNIVEWLFPIWVHFEFNTHWRNWWYKYFLTELNSFLFGICQNLNPQTSLVASCRATHWAMMTWCFLNLYYSSVDDAYSTAMTQLPDTQLWKTYEYQTFTGR